jgi:DNA ligase 1
MPDIEDGESVEIQGSAKDPYILKNLGGVYSCSCPAWRTQSHPIEIRTCKHLRKYRGEQAEKDRLGGELPAKPTVSRRKAVGKTSTGADGASDEVESNVPPILLAHSWDNLLDLSGWWMSEKLDGVRAYWDGKQFISRQGNVYMAPDWFVEDLPRDIHLDGELWIARKAFQRTVSIVRRQDKSKEWEAVKYVVFDAPQVDDVFEARIAFIQQCLDEARPKYARPHEQERCKNPEHLLEQLRLVEEGGGEGLMLRQPNSKYETGRSSTLLKVKRFHDREARVLEHLPGTGKHKGRMGALSVELNDGTKFAIGTGFSDRERDNPPPVGSIVTFRYQELTDGGVPRFPSYVRLRTDIDSLPDPSQKGDVGSVSKVKASSDENVVAETLAPLAASDSMTATPSAPPASVSNVVAFAPRKAKAEDDLDGSTRDGTQSTPRYFEFVEADSSKFWSIWRTGSDVTVRYGKIGTNGQEKTKNFNDDAAANKYYNEIIGEKIDKGYVEKNRAGGAGDAFVGSGSSNQDYDSGVDYDDQEQDDGDDADVDGVEAGNRRLAKSLTQSEDAYRVPEYYKLVARGPVHCYCSTCRPDLAGIQNPISTYAAVAQLTGQSAAMQSASSTSTATATKSVTAKPATSVATTGVRYFEFVEGASSKFWSIVMNGNDVIVRYGRIGTAGQEKSKSFTSQSAARKYYDDIIEEKVGKGYSEKSQD